MKYIIFDPDGTLVDSRLGIIYLIGTAIRQVLPKINLAEVEFRIGQPIQKILLDELKISDEQKLTKIEAAFRVSYNKIGSKQTIIYPNVIKTLRKMSHLNIICFVATYKPIIPIS